MELDLASSGRPTNLWLANHNKLPTLILLNHRNIITETNCPHCPNDEETTEHVLRLCPKAQELWTGLEIEKEFAFLHNCSFQEWIKKRLFLVGYFQEIRSTTVGYDIGIWLLT